MRPKPAFGRAVTTIATDAIGEFKILSPSCRVQHIHGVAIEAPLRLLRQNTKLDAPPDFERLFVCKYGISMVMLINGHPRRELVLL
jgi:hypothetical protein